MDRRNLFLATGIIVLAIAALSFNNYLSPTGAVVVGGAAGSLAVAAITLIVALTLFAKYFGLLR